MPKLAIWNNPYYQNIFLLVLVILTSLCYLSCNVENIEMLEIKKVEVKDEVKDEKDNEKPKNVEKFLDWSMYNPPIVNGYTPQWWTRNSQNIMYNQGDPNLMPQVIGCGGRRGPCLGTQTIPVINAPIEISERNIAPVNIISNPDAVGITQQVGVLYKILGTLNEIFPLYGVRRYRNSDTWDYFTKVGKEGNFVTLKVLTKRVNNNELQTNDIVILDGNSSKFRTVIYDNNYPSYVPYFKG